MVTVNIKQAEADFEQLVARAEAGEEIVISRGNKPAVRLEAIGKARAEPRKPGRWKGRFSVPDSALEPLSPEELGDWDLRQPYGGFNE